MPTPKRRDVETKLSASQEKLLAKLAPFRSDAHLSALRRFLGLGHAYPAARSLAIATSGL
jgi:hypothetical protein